MDSNAIQLENIKEFIIKGRIQSTSGSLFQIGRALNMLVGVYNFLAVFDAVGVSAFKAIISKQNSH